jgi:hypothetical protein
VDERQELLQCSKITGAEEAGLLATDRSRLQLIAVDCDGQLAVLALWRERENALAAEGGCHSRERTELQ